MARPPVTSTPPKAMTISVTRTSAARRGRPRHADRHGLRRRAGDRRPRHRSDRPPPGYRRARDLDAVVLRRLARRRRPHDPLLAPAALAPRSPPMTLVTLVFLALLALGVPVAMTVGMAGYAGALLAAPAPLARTVQNHLPQVASF